MRQEAQKARRIMTNQETDTTTGNGGQPAPIGAPSLVPSKARAKPKKKARQSRKAANTANLKSATAKKTRAGKATKSSSAKGPERPKAETKGATIMTLVRRAKGASLPELMQATGWQAHSVRGFLSITGRKQGLKIESSKNESGERVYSILR